MPIDATTTVTHVELVGGTWWITYLVAPLVSAAVALVAAYAGYRLSLRAQRRAATEARTIAARDAQAVQNTTLALLMASIDDNVVKLEARSPGRQPPVVTLQSLKDAAVATGTGTQLGSLVAAEAGYSSARDAWTSGDAPADADVAEHAGKLVTALEALKAASEAALTNGRTRLDGLEATLP